MTDPKESVFTLAQLERLLSKTDPTSVLVGGQALIYWVDRYGISVPPARLTEGISSDADFLGDRSIVSRLAEGVRGTASYPSQHAITALVGQVTIPLKDSEFLNVDVIEHVVRIGTSGAGRKASKEFGIEFLLAIPVHVIDNASFLTQRWPQIGKALAAPRTSR